MLKLHIKFFLIFIGVNLLFGCIEQKRRFIQAIPFEKQKWFGVGSDGISDAAIQYRFRPGMARYLIQKELLVGKNRAELSEMLGEYEESAHEPIIVRYGLEDIWGSNIDPIAIEYLRLTFNEKDKVEKAEIEFFKTGDWSKF